jgi:hexosaminidase
MMTMTKAMCRGAMTNVRLQACLPIGFILISAVLHAQTSGPGPVPPLMPLPKSIVMQGSPVAVDERFHIDASGPGAADPRVQAAIVRTMQRVERQTGLLLHPQGVDNATPATLRIVVAGPDHPGPQRLGNDESYSLVSSQSYVRLDSPRPLGVLRGLETFLQLIQAAPPSVGQGFYVPGLLIHDEPRFAWRGLSLDCSRHFISVSAIERTIDGMAAVKLNVLHWHLTDDEGFRIESKRYPRLQEYGSDGLFYTQEEVKAVILHARNRGIRVVPEFDMPGHSMSWFPGYPELADGPRPYKILREPIPATVVMDPTREETYEFIDGFIGEMALLFPDAYFHIGGDEVGFNIWNGDPRVVAFMKRHNLADASALQGYFIRRVTEIVMKHGKRVIGWDDVLQPNAPKTIIVESYRGQKFLAGAARQGYDAILSTGYYLDLLLPASEHYLVDPLQEDVSTLPPQEQKHVLGGEAAMWEEIATEENLDAKLWPRLAAIAERLWSPEPVRDVPSMYSRLEVINRWLEWLGLTQRSNLELMRQRLAGNMPAASLDTFASILEPVKNFERQPRFSTLAPLNHLADALSPESDTAREFQAAVASYLASPTNVEEASSLRSQLQQWQRSAVLALPVLRSNSLAAENVATAKAVDELCQAGIEALDALSSGKSQSAEWKQRASRVVEEGLKPHADTLIQIAPAVKALVEAASILYQVEF